MQVHSNVRSIIESETIIDRDKEEKKSTAMLGSLILE